MESNNKKYWKGVEELNSAPEFEVLKDKEFDKDTIVEDLIADKKSGMDRRDFLKSLGFGLGAVALAACNKAPIRNSVPYLIKPEEITPGIPNYYTGFSSEGYGITVTTREGRPTKIEGNPNCPIAKGGVNAQGHASVLDLYDSSKLQTPLLQSKKATWDDVDAYVKDGLKNTQNSGKQIVILTQSISSPSTQKAVAMFTSAYSQARVVTYDAVSYSGIINANKNSFDKAVIPSYNFDKAKVIVSFGADFLGSWISPVEFMKQYASTRSADYLKENKAMSRHIQFETELSLTGSNADVRIPVRPSQLNLALIGLYNNIAKLAGIPIYSNVQTPEFAGNIIAKTAKELWANKGQSLVVCGSNDVANQVMVNAINSLLSSYANTINLDQANLKYQSNDADITYLLQDIQNGKVGALIVYGTNPVYSLPNGAAFQEAIANKVPLKISFADRADETAAIFNVIAPDRHSLESWTDAQPRTELYYIGQPTIYPIYDTRQAQESLLIWSNNTVVYADFVKDVWNTQVFSQISGSNAQKSWDKLLQEGFVQINQPAAKSYTFQKDLDQVVKTLVSNSQVDASAIEATLYVSVNLKDGRNANNPLLQENPDPISKVTWDNYIAISPKFAGEQGLKQGDVVTLTANNGATLTLPVLLQPGQAYQTVSVALGYGRTAAGKAGNNVGKNAFPLVNVSNGGFQYCTVVNKLTKTGDRYEFAQTQTHESLEGRDIVRETTLSDYAKNPYAGSKGHEDLTTLAQKDADGNPQYDRFGKLKLLNLWDDKETKGFKWGMAIDLNACTGCGACIVSCNIENNVAVVGRDEVRRRREMHWLRLDRYYSTVEEGTEGYMGDHSNEEAVEVIHQPMLCQHCDHASCETVCPVLATMHSEEGLNQMAYNRCFGTRYCANNCPYKVRRFNWFNYADNEDFDYYMNNPMGKLMLNPDVVVRTRGVMEKCSMCVQRIQAGKLKAKVENRQLADGDIKTACQQSCPSNAIIFGNINDPESQVSKLMRNERKFYALEAIGMQPNIGYLTMVRNKTRETSGHNSHH